MLQKQIRAEVAATISSLFEDEDSFDFDDFDFSEYDLEDDQWASRESGIQLSYSGIKNQDIYSYWEYNQEDHQKYA